MSDETMEWLQQYTMLGNIKSKERYASNNWMILDQQTGEYKAWWDNGTFTNKYDGPIPVEEVERVLFNWKPVEAESWYRVLCDADVADGTDGRGRSFRWVADLEHKGILHPDTDHVYGNFGTTSYTVHDYNKWLVENVHELLKGKAGIDTAGLLRLGGQAYVSMTLPENIVCDSGLEIRPAVIAATSIDGTMSTTYAKATLLPVCDNSLRASIQGAIKALKIKHSSKSLDRFDGVREELDIVIEKEAEMMVGFLDSLTKVDVTDSEFLRIVQGMAPIDVPEVKDGKVTNQRKITVAQNKQGELLNLWRADPRVVKFNGTLLGAFQAANTWNQHFRSNNDNGVERGMTGLLSKGFANADEEFWSIVGGIETIKVPELIVVGGR